MINEELLIQLQIIATTKNITTSQLINKVLQNYVNTFLDNRAMQLSNKDKPKCKSTEQLELEKKVKTHFENLFKSKGIIYTAPSYVFTLKLENNKYYVGYSSSILTRLVTLFTSNATLWTSLHKPVELISLKQEPKEYVNTQTLIAMAEFGIANVRGGSWSKPDLLITSSIKSKVAKFL